MASRANVESAWSRVTGLLIAAAPSDVMHGMQGGAAAAVFRACRCVLLS